MEKKFIIQEVKNREFPIIVQSVDCSRLDDYILDISKILTKKAYKGIVLIDLLTANGLKDRFFTIVFNGKTFEYSSIKSIKKVPSKIMTESNSFYINNIRFLQNSVLTQAQKFLFEKKFSIVD